MTYLIIYPSQVVTVSPQRVSNPAPEERGEIKGFTARSRRRLFELMHSIEFDNPLLITLTYPEYPTDGRVFKAHLKAFREVWTRAYGRSRVIWKLEFQKRGAPHYHLLSLDVPHVDIPRLGGAWCRIAGIEGQEGTWQAFDVKSKDKDGKDLANPVAYISKYIGKTTELEDGQDITNVGRFWGAWWVKKNVLARLDIPKGMEVIASEIILDWMGLKKAPYEGYSPYGSTVFVERAGRMRSYQNLLDRFVEAGVL